jgi:hypothetical protein
LPRGVLLTQFVNECHVSLSFISGTLLGQSVLFALTAACAGALLVGYRTTLATFLSWFLLISLHNRNLMILDSGDVVLQMLLFWSMFLPLGAAYSVGTLRERTQQKHQVRICSVGSAALLLQICFIYWFTAALKTDLAWRHEGSAVYYALSLDIFATDVGVWVRRFPQLMTALTFSTFALETFGPCLLFTPIVNGPIRCLTILLFLGFHIGIGLCLELGLFPFIMLTAWLCLLPSWFWEKFSVPSDFSAEQKEQIRRWARKWPSLRSRVCWVRYEQPSRWRSTLSATLCATCLIYVFLWNLRTTDFNKYSRHFSGDYNWIGYMIRLDQMWNMFAPKPMLDDGWYVIPARLRNGKEIDLMTEAGPVRWEKPEAVYKTYRNQRWRKYLLNLWEREYAGHRLYFGRYLCRNWNASHTGSDTLRAFQIYFMKETTLPEGEVAPVEKVLLWDHNCFG